MPMLFVSVPASQSPEIVLQVAALLGDHELGRFVTVLLPASYDLGTVTTALNTVRTPQGAAQLACGMKFVEGC